MSHLKTQLVSLDAVEATRISSGKIANFTDNEFQQSWQVSFAGKGNPNLVEPFDLFFQSLRQNDLLPPFMPLSCYDNEDRAATNPKSAIYNLQSEILTPYISVLRASPSPTQEPMIRPVSRTS